MSVVARHQASFMPRCLTQTTLMGKRALVTEAPGVRVVAASKHALSCASRWRNCATSGRAFLLGDALEELQEREVREARLLVGRYARDSVRTEGSAMAQLRHEESGTSKECARTKR